MHAGWVRNVARIEAAGASATFRTHTVHFVAPIAAAGARATFRTLTDAGFVAPIARRCARETKPAQ
jgi:hypothetical protein